MEGQNENASSEDLNQTKQGAVCVWHKQVTEQLLSPTKYV